MANTSCNQLSDEAGSRFSKQRINTILAGDCATALHPYPDGCVDLILTSPPYAGKRAGSVVIHERDYVDWFLPRASEFYRLLSPTGSFVLNIKEGAKDGQRQTYVMELVLALCKQGWRWTEEYIWHKRNCAPGKWPNRFRDAWEHIYHFTKQKHFHMDQDAVMVPAAASTIARSAHLSAKDHHREESAVGSGFGKKRANWVGRDKVYPANVLHLPTECANQGHHSSFPVPLARFFVKLFTRTGDLVADPFAGCASAGVAAVQMDRLFLGVELVPEFRERALARIAAAQAKKLRGQGTDA